MNNDETMDMGEEEPSSSVDYPEQSMTADAFRNTNANGTNICFSPKNHISLNTNGGTTMNVDETQSSSQQRYAKIYKPNKNAEEPMTSGASRPQTGTKRKCEDICDCGISVDATGHDGTGYVCAGLHCATNPVLKKLYLMINEPSMGVQEALHVEDDNSRNHILHKVMVRGNNPPTCTYSSKTHAIASPRALHCGDGLPDGLAPMDEERSYLMAHSNLENNKNKTSLTTWLEQREMHSRIVDDKHRAILNNLLSEEYDSDDESDDHLHGNALKVCPSQSQMSLEEPLTPCREDTCPKIPTIPEDSDSDCEWSSAVDSYFNRSE